MGNHQYEISGSVIQITALEILDETMNIRAMMDDKIFAEQFLKIGDQISIESPLSSLGDGESAWNKSEKSDFIGESEDGSTIVSMEVETTRTSSGNAYTTIKFRRKNRDSNKDGKVDPDEEGETTDIYVWLGPSGPIVEDRSPTGN